jgi:hypothetical protein
MLRSILCNGVRSDGEWQETWSNVVRDTQREQRRHDRQTTQIEVSRHDCRKKHQHDEENLTRMVMFIELSFGKTMGVFRDKIGVRFVWSN